MNETKNRYRKPNRNYKDTVFRMLFREKKELLTLFNAIHGTSYENADDLEVTTLENAVYMSLKNDISCVLDMRLDLYEHQSTVNPNMPLRDLFYVSRLLEDRVKNRDIYSRHRITLPVPQFIVFYNGSEPQPERREFRLSDSFAKKDGEVCLELVVVQLNINPGYNTDLIGNCRTLREYMQYTDRVRRYGMELPLEEAVERAVNECIEQGILSEFLQKNRNEVIPMSIFEYDEEKHMKTVREEGYEDGVNWGLERGIEEGIEQGINQKEHQVICNMLQHNQPPELISQFVEKPVEYIYAVKQELQGEVREDSKYKKEKE